MGVELIEIDFQNQRRSLAKILREMINGELKAWYVSAHNRFFDFRNKKLKQMFEATSASSFEKL